MGIIIALVVLGAVAIATICAVRMRENRRPDPNSVAEIAARIDRQRAQTRRAWAAVQACDSSAAILNVPHAHAELMLHSHHGPRCRRRAMAMARVSTPLPE